MIALAEFLLFQLLANNYNITHHAKSSQVFANLMVAYLNLLLDAWCSRRRATRATVARRASAFGARGASRATLTLVLGAVAASFVSATHVDSFSVSLL